MEVKVFNTFYNEKAKEWSGRSPPLLYHPNVSLGQVILNALEKHPNLVIQISDNNGIELTTDQLRIYAIRAALHLSRFKLSNDDCIGIVARNHHHIAPIVIAALLIGVPVNLLDPAFDSAEIHQKFNLTKPNVIFCDYDLHDRVKKATAEIGLNPTFITLDQKMERAEFVEDFLQAIDGVDNFVPIQIENGEKCIALIMCSSGTTGLSKAVCLSHSQVTHQFTSIFHQTYKDVYLNFSAMNSITGIVSMLNGSVTCCKRIITTEKFTPELFMKIVQKYKVTQMLGPPTYLGLTLHHPKVLEYDLSSLQYYVCGGSVVPGEYVIKARSIFKNCKLDNAYGISELGGLAAYNSSDNPQAVGYVATNLKMRIIDGDGINLGIDEDGEIIIKPIYFFLGYKGNPELSKVVASTGGWIYSGDIGHFDKDGLLFIVDRKIDILKYQNYTIFPSEIEQFLLKHRFIKSVCVVGIRDLLNCDLPAALIVKTPGCMENDNEIKEKVCFAIKENLADYKILRGGIYIVDELPLTFSGKILKRKAQEIATDLYNKAKNI